MTDTSHRDPRRSPNRLYRDPARGKLLGVCAGIADYFGIEPWIVRVITIIAFFPFTFLTVLAYVMAGVLLEKKPPDLYETPGDADMWRNIRTRPGQTAGDLRHRFRELERRLRDLEAYLTSREFKLNREFRDLEG